MRFYTFGQKMSMVLFVVNIVFLIAYVINDLSWDGQLDGANLGGIILTGMFGMGCLWYALAGNARSYTA